MSHTKYSWMPVLLLAGAAIALSTLLVNTPYAQSGTYCNPDNGCCAWVGTIQGLCCWAYDCGGGDSGAGCDVCTLAKTRRNNPELHAQYPEMGHRTSERQTDSTFAAVSERQRNQ